MGSNVHFHHLCVCLSIFNSFWLCGVAVVIILLAYCGCCCFFLRFRTFVVIFISIPSMPYIDSILSNVCMFVLNNIWSRQRTTESKISNICQQQCIGCYKLHTNSSKYELSLKCVCVCERCLERWNDTSTKETVCTHITASEEKNWQKEKNSLKWKTCAMH